MICKYSRMKSISKELAGTATKIENRGGKALRGLCALRSCIGPSRDKGVSLRMTGLRSQYGPRKTGAANNRGTGKI
jgi:hypothetical protein